MTPPSLPPDLTLFFQAICSLQETEKCVMNLKHFPNSIVRKGQGGPKPLTVRIVQMLSIGAFSHAMMEKFLANEEKIRAGFESKAATSSRPEVGSDEDDEVDMPYGEGKKLLCDQVHGLIGKWCGKDNRIYYTRKEEFYRRFGMSHLTLGMMDHCHRSVDGRAGYHFPGTIASMEQKVLDLHSRVWIVKNEAGGRRQAY